MQRRISLWCSDLGFISHHNRKVLERDANPLVGDVAGAARRGDAAPAEVHVVPRLGEQALVDAVEQHAAVLEQDGRAGHRSSTHRLDGVGLVKRIHWPATSPHASP